MALAPAIGATTMPPRGLLAVQLFSDPRNGSPLLAPLEDLPHPFRFLFIDAKTSLRFWSTVLQGLFRVHQERLVSVGVVTGRKLAEHATKLPPANAAAKFPDGRRVVEFHHFDSQFPTGLLGVDPFAG